jgi:hypothetical protein
VKIDAVEHVEVLEPLVDLYESDHPENSRCEKARNMSGPRVKTNGLFYYLDCEKSRTI